MDLEYIYKDMFEERAARKEHEGTIQGTCEEFCPKFEYIERVIRGDINKYEKDVVFKKFYRSSAGKSKSFPEDVRPIEVLFQATNYLVNLSYNDFSVEMYKFIENRTRAIRTDISLQELNCETTINILERIARFHIVYNYALFDKKEFEAHLNQDQLKKILLTLEGMYSQAKKYNEEFISYILLISIDGKYPQLENLLFLPKVQRAYEIRKFYQQGNIYRYFLETKKIDLLSFSASLMNFYRIRMKAVEIYGKSLMEKIDISFFQDLLYASKIELRSILNKMNIEIHSDKADFKDIDIYETEDFVIKERKEAIGLSSISSLIYLGDIDFKIYQIIFSKYLVNFIEQKYKKKVNLRPIGQTTHSDVRQDLMRNIFDALINKICIKYTQLIHGNIKKLVFDKQNKKDIVKNLCYFVLQAYLKDLSLRYAKKYTSSLLLKKKVLDWVSSCKGIKSLDTPDPSQVLERQSLAIVLNDSIYSVLLRNSIEKSKISSLDPTFINFKGVVPQKLLKFNLSVFSVDKGSLKTVKDNFYMLNKIVDTPQNLLKMFDTIEEAVKKSKLIVKSKIMTLLKDKSKNKQIFIVTRLIENKRNSPELEDILIKVHSNKAFKNIDVYFEEGELF